MPTYTVVFGGSVVYQQGHPKAERSLTEMRVNAPTVQFAYQHAVRSCVGAEFPAAIYDSLGTKVWGMTETDFAPEPPAAPVQEAQQDTPLVYPDA